MEGFMGLLCAKRRSRLLWGVILSFSLLFLQQSLYAISVAFTYDAAGRLLTAQYGDGQHVVYAYDAVGNMAQQVSSGSGGGALIGPVIQLLLNNAHKTSPTASVLNQ